MRLNFSHATEEEVELRVKNLKLCNGRHGATLDGTPDKNVRAVLLDTRGPEIRMGKLRDDFSGHETIELKAGSSITLHTTDEWANNGSTETDLYINYSKLHKVVYPGSKVLLDDGAVILTVKVVEDKEYHGHVICTVDNSGDLRSRAGVNLPGAVTDLPAMSSKDKIDIKYGMTKDIDYIAASFIQSAANVREIKHYVKECAEELGWEAGYPLPLIISKIESATALTNFDEILDESDGIMVARGDLGVEIPIHQVTNAQKEMVAACNAVGKPVIVATQMLESMAKNPRPTRAEVSDVTNAVYDGADAVMTSGETAKGKYPVETVQMMNEIISSAEKFSFSRPDLVSPCYGGELFVNKTDLGCNEASIAKASVTAATKRQASAIIVISKGTSLPRLVAAYRPSVPIVTFVPSSKLARQLIIHRGIHPVVGTLGGLSFHKRPAVAIKYAKDMGFVQANDDVVVVGIEDDEEEEFATMKIASVP